MREKPLFHFQAIWPMKRLLVTSFQVFLTLVCLSILFITRAEFLWPKSDHSHAEPRESYRKSENDLLDETFKGIDNAQEVKNIRK